MKKLLVFSLVIALLLATAMPALAGRGPQLEAKGRARGGAASFTATGVITSVDSITKTVTFRVVAGNPLVKPLVGQGLTIQTGENTRFLLKTSTGTVPATFDDLAVDQKISVQGAVVGSTWTAQRITIGAQLVHQP